MWVGIDDTDSVQGGCTTYVATEVITQMEYDLIGLPRLVRLNPNIPWKTRGNGAMALHVGIGGGKRHMIGEIEGKPVYCYSHRKREANFSEMAALLEKIIRRHMKRDAQPAYVISTRKPPASLYWKAVRTLVEKEEVMAELDGTAEYRLYNGGRGIIGASAAISWRPGDRTYELITYGNEKWIERESVIAMDRACPGTFNNYDYRNEYIALLPKSTSPVFYGIRGDSVEELYRAKEMLVTSKEERWLIFETNQATDDHLQRKKISQVKPYESVIVEGCVKREPYVIKGGHLIFSISDGHEIDCTAYEPTKEFRDVVKELKRGDEVVVYGGVRKQPFTINIEKTKVLNLVEVYQKRENPVCPVCKKHMKSAGRGKGYKCPICGNKAGEEDAKYDRVKRYIRPGFYEVPVIARRHLAKPLKRMAVMPESI
ncbi:MAG: DNA-binding protein [Thermoplasmata archaeon]|nr:MAG: DNA-binding protein [Thermoplasmata archaeon]